MLKTKEGKADSIALLDALSEGYGRVATIQPEALRKSTEQEQETVNLRALPNDVRVQVMNLLKSQTGDGS